MKRLLYILPLAAAVMFTACSDDDDNSPAGGGAAPAGTVKAKVNGTDFTSVAMSTYAVETFGGMTINAANSAGQTITLQMPGDSVGTYTGATVTCGYMEMNMSNPQQSPSWQANNAQTNVKISKNENNKVSGTFSFTAEASSGGATGTKTVTDGSFTDVAIQ